MQGFSQIWSPRLPTSHFISLLSLVLTPIRFVPAFHESVSISVVGEKAMHGAEKHVHSLGLNCHNSIWGISESLPEIREGVSVCWHCLETTKVLFYAACIQSPYRARFAMTSPLTLKFLGPLYGYLNCYHSLISLFCTKCRFVWNGRRWDVGEWWVERVGNEDYEILPIAVRILSDFMW